ncbi:MAG: ABC transporter ATP-binding protein [Patescibacteria group bacterium]
MDNNSIIKIKKVTKFFKVPHQKRSTLKESFVGLFSRRSYEQFQALSDIDLEVKKGEFLGVIGPNGSGKSTLLKIIAGILQPNTGQVTVRGKISPFLELGVGFQPDLSARDNVYLYGAILGMTRKEINQKFEQIIKFAELENFVDQKLKNYSSGMVVRLAFATAIQAPADILLVDEVLAVGDILFQRKCFNEFKRLKNERKTVVYVSHDLKSVDQFCDRVVLLDKGKIRREGDSSDVVHCYKVSELDSIKDEKAADQKRATKKKRDIEILDVRFINKKGEGPRIISTHETMRVIIYYNAKKPIDSPIFQVQIYRDDGTMFNGEYTARHGIDLGTVLGKGALELNYSDICLLEGNYEALIRIWPKNFAGEPFDEKDNAFKFSVISEAHDGGGMCSMGTEWAVKK